MPLARDPYNRILSPSTKPSTRPPWLDIGSDSDEHSWSCNDRPTSHAGRRCSKVHFIARTIGCVSCALAVQSAAAQGQVLRGVVHDSTAVVPLAGAVVVTLDANGDSIARTITDSAGRFVLTSAIADRADRLRVIRIGYLPREIR